MYEGFSDMDLIHRRDAKYTSVGVQVQFDPLAAHLLKDKDSSRRDDGEGSRSWYRKLYIRAKLYVADVLRSQICLVLVFCLLFVAIVAVAPHPTGRRYAIFRSIPEPELNTEPELDKDNPTVDQKHHTRHHVKRKHIFGHEKKEYKKHKKLKHKHKATESKEGISSLYDVLHFKSKRIFTYDNVCIEKEKGNPVKIVVYSHAGSMVPPKVLISHWPMEFKTEPVPTEDVIEQKAPAYFVRGPQSGQIFEFWKDFYVQLLHNLNVTRRLRQPPNTLVLSEKSGDWESFLPFIRTLPFPSHQVLTLDEIPHKTCYAHGVFGTDNPHNLDWTAASKYLYKIMKINSHRCPKDGVTIVGHSQTMSLQNVAGMYNTTVKVGYHALDFSSFAVSLFKLLKASRCSHILVGIQHAIMDFLPFLKSGTKVVEIYWEPQTPVLDVVNTEMKLGLIIKPLKVDLIDIKWDSYSKICNKGIPIKESEKKPLMKIHNKGMCGDVRHFAKGFVDTDKYVDILNSFKVGYQQVIKAERNDTKKSLSLTQIIGHKGKHRLMKTV